MTIEILNEKRSFSIKCQGQGKVGDMRQVEVNGNNHSSCICW